MTVRQAEAEGPEGAGLVGGEEAGILRMLVIVNSRNLADAARHRHRQFAGRIDLAGKDFGDGLATHLAGFPDIKDRVHIFLGPCEAIRSARHQYEYCRFARRGHSLK